MEVLLHISPVIPQTQTFYHRLQICCMTSYLHFINLITHLVILMVQQVIYIYKFYYFSLFILANPVSAMLRLALTHPPCLKVRFALQISLFWPLTSD